MDDLYPNTRATENVALSGSQDGCMEENVGNSTGSGIEEGGEEEMAVAIEEVVARSKPSKRKRYVDDFITSADAAKRLGITREQMGNLIAAGRVYAKKLGPRTVLVPIDEVERLQQEGPRKTGRPRKNV